MAAGSLRRFLHKTVVITASTDGIGFATARRFAEEGAYVVISSRKQENVDKALSSLHSQGLQNVSGIVCDVSSNIDQEALLKHTLEKRPGVDVLVSNAAAVIPGSILEIPESDWDSTMNVNLKSHVFLTQRFTPHIKLRGNGSIIYMSSIAGYLPGFNTYGISKAGIISLTKAAAGILGPLNIRVNAIAPGVIETAMAQPVTSSPELTAKFTDMTMLKRLGKPEEIASVVAFLASEDASYITGEVIIAAGGTHIRP